MKKEDNKIPQAWDLISKAPNSGYSERESSIDWNDIEDIMIEYAKLHVKAALNLAYQKSEVYNKSKFPGDINYQVEPDSILNAYPLDLIK